VLLDSLAAAADPEGDPLRVVAVETANTVGVARIEGEAGLRFDPDGRFEALGAGESRLTNFGYTLSDGRGGTASGRALITIEGVDDLPLAAADSAGRTEDDPPRSIDVLANDTDVDGGPRSVASATQPSHGTVAVIGGGVSVTYEPQPQYCGPDSFEYTLNGDSSAIVTLDVACEDDPPVAVADAATFEEDEGAAQIDVLANDTDSDGGPIAVASVADPAHGTATVTPGGDAVEYAPDADYCGPDSFEYTLSGGSSAGVSLTVACSDDPPVAVADQGQVQQGAAATAVDVLANDTDVDGGPRSVASATQPPNGSVVVAVDGSGLSYQPDASYCNDGEAADQFSYTLEGGSSAEVEIAVSCVTAIQADPPLTPSFDPDVSDYTVACDGGSPLGFSGRTAAGATVSVDGQPAAGGKFETEAALDENQELSFTVDENGADEYFVRCLPADFPTWEYERLRTPSHPFYVVTPGLGAGAKPYVVVFDDAGVPVWWYRQEPAPIDAEVFDDGTISWFKNEFEGYEIRELDGTLVQMVAAAEGNTDLHELEREPNGDYLMISSNHPRLHVDLTEYGGGADDTVADQQVEEIAPNGEQVWKWDTKDHIDLDQTGRWWPKIIGEPFKDIIHMNAVEPVGDDAVLISVRHNDAIYKIDKASGEIVWKLGGIWTPESLNVLGDPQGSYPLGGQHDVRLEPDGTVTVYDNNTGFAPSPRALRYAIDENARTATLLESVTDPLVPSSFCCGSARHSADGSWLMSWGGRSLVTEFDAAGDRAFKLGFGGTAFSYRADSAPEGSLEIDDLRAGMDAMFPR
jgi:hypothetical protein